jgi:hypothetical protein
MTSFLKLYSNASHFDFGTIFFTDLIAISKMRQYMIVLGNILALSVPDEGYSLSVPDEGYSRNSSCPLLLISTVLLLSILGARKPKIRNRIAKIS